MSDSDHPTSSPPARKRNKPPPFQFSLAWLMAFVTAFAILLGLASATEGSLFGLVFASVVWYVFPTSLVACAFYARGDFQAFAIGALIPCLSLIVGGPMRQVANAGTFWVLIYLLLAGGVCGIVATLTRRWIEQHGGD